MPEHAFEPSPTGAPEQHIADQPDTGEVARRIGRWWPRDEPDDAQTTAAVCVTRQIVANGNPDTAAKAGQALTHVWRYVRWRLDTTADVDITDPDSVLTADAVAAFLDADDGLGALPAGSRTPARSFLNRLASGTGLNATRASTTKATDRQATATAPVDAAEIEALGLAQCRGVQLPLPWAAGRQSDPVLGPLDATWPDLDPLVATALAGYVPDVLPENRASRIMPLVRAAVARTRPRHRPVMLATARPAAYLAAWTDTHRRPLRADVVFAAATLTEFLTLVADRLGPATAATYRTRLVATAEAVLPDQDLSGLPTFPRVTAKQACTPTEVTAAFRWAKHRRTERTRRHSKALVTLAVAAGLDGSDSPWVRPDDVVPIEAGTGIELWKPAGDSGELTHVRTTFVLPQYETALQAVVDAAVEAGDPYLIGATSAPSQQRRINSLRPGTARNGSDTVDLTRLRNTWLLELVTGADLNIFEVMDAAGLATLITVEDLLDHARSRGATHGLRRASRRRR